MRKRGIAPVLDDARALLRDLLASPELREGRTLGHAVRGAGWEPDRAACLAAMYALGRASGRIGRVPGGDPLLASLAVIGEDPETAVDVLAFSRAMFLSGDDARRCVQAARGCVAVIASTRGGAVALQASRGAEEGL